MKDYYKILNINSNSSEDEIKKSYRSLAQKYHPDKTNGSTAKKFCEINEAYSVLSDPIKRKKYDIEFLDKEKTIENILNQSFFKDFGFFGKKQKNIYTSVNLKVYLTEGTKNKVIKVIKKNKCRSCSGYGGDYVGVCNSCNGTGNGFISYSKKASVNNCKCINCSGRGYIINGICRVCNGKKEVEITEEYNIKIEVSKK